jgi:hypothetical protein
MNKFRNEKKITLGEVEILLRPTFANIATVETELGSIAALAIKISSGKENSDSQVPINLIAKFFYLMQVEEKYSQEDIFQMVIEEGYQSCRIQLLQFFILLTAGKKSMALMDQAQQEKKV